jgi:hypothetical protein
MFSNGFAVVNNFLGKKGLLLLGGTRSFQNTNDMRALTGHSRIQFWELDGKTAPENITRTDLKNW